VGHGGEGVALWQTAVVALRSDLQVLFDVIRAEYPEGVGLDDFAAFLLDKQVTYADVEALIAAFTEIGVDLTAPEPVSPEELGRVLAAARAIAGETGQRPSAAEIGARTGLSPVAVLRALRLGRTLGSAS
jgi:hypothetical protein